MVTVSERRIVQPLNLPYHHFVNATGLISQPEHSSITMAGHDFVPRRLRQELEDTWRRRLDETFEVYRAATANCERLLVASSDGRPPGPLSPLSNARRAQSEALQEYARVLHIFSDLVIHGKLPEDLH